MSEKTEKRQLIILKILRKANRPLGSAKIMENLEAFGQDINERTVRHYLMEMDNKGLTKNLGRKGRIITDEGLAELNTARIFDKVGFLAAKIDQLTYRMTFDLNNLRGTVITNISLLTPEQLKTLSPLICRVYEEGYSMGDMMALFEPGEKIGNVAVPQNMLGLGTICSITINGVLLAHGIPTRSTFGGLLELRNREPLRFAEIITYEGSSMDPLEIFIKTGMTDYMGATTTGNGRIGVGFREMPADSRDSVVNLTHKLKKAGLGCFLKIGWPGQPLLEIPVNEGRFGAIVIGGLNPIAILEEIDIKIKSRALAGMIEYEKLFHYQELAGKIKGII
ncbi:MAG: NrpR regulatory domain-containing protein [Thermodesulfobacteriota bacterium]